jgi:hypothetical protein
MKPLLVIYWARFALGAVSGLVCTLLPLVGALLANGTIVGAFQNPSGLLTTSYLINGITVALAVYLVSFYLLKARLGAKVEKPSKIMTMGIGMYFFTWIVCWILFLSIAIGAPPIKA